MSGVTAAGKSVARKLASQVCELRALHAGGAVQMGKVCLHILTNAWSSAYPTLTLAYCAACWGTVQTGEICLDILKNAWSPAWTLQSVCQAIVALMSDTAPDSPLNCDAGNLLRANDRRGYNSLARMYTLELATHC